MKSKQCKNKNCGNKFTPERQFQTTCDYNCAIEYAKQLKEKKEASVKKDNNKAKKEFNQNDRKYLLELAQKTVNTFIRMRDGKYCISCGKSGDTGAWHAGHFKAQGGNSALRFDENNIHVQCYRCNVELSSNQSGYRPALIEKIGLDEVIRLETTKNTKLWKVEELQDIIKTYKQKIKQI